MKLLRYGPSGQEKPGILDREGRIRAMMPYGHSADDFAHDVALLLAK